MTRKRLDLPIKVNRKPPQPKPLPFTDVFKGFEKVRAVREVFGDDTKKVLGRLKVELMPFRYMYMGVRDNDGSLAVGTYHLRNSDARTLYLDVVHELFHVGQFMRDRAWFGKEHLKYLRNGFDTALYYQSPIEVPAYKHAVDEARRIGMTYDEIVEYLKLGPVDRGVFSKFLEDMELRPDMHPPPKVRIPVQINRDVSVPVYPFTDYFEGFEELPAVTSLLGEKTEKVLGGLKVAFGFSRWGLISLNEEDRCLEVGSQYLERGDRRLIYMDIILCLNLLARASGRKDIPERTAPGYGENPETVMAYKAAVMEARRVGVPVPDILEHLTYLRFIMPPPAFRKFVRKLGLGARR